MKIDMKKDMFEIQVDETKIEFAVEKVKIESTTSPLQRKNCSLSFIICLC